MKPVRYVIEMNHRKLTEYDPNCMFWSNDHGWCSLEFATAFSDAEVSSLHLPLDGKWVRLPS